MAKITEFLKKIKEARRGLDVRDSIHDSIEAMNNQIENELGGMIEDGNTVINNMQEEIQSVQDMKANGDLLMKPSDLTQEHWDKIKTNVTNYYKRYESTYTTVEENESNIPINISSYNEGSILEVYIEGRMLTREEYKINGTNSITLTTALSEVGTKVHFIVYRSVCATNEDFEKLKGDKGDSGAIVFDSVADMKANTSLKAGDTCQTLGYYEENDGGAGLYRIVNDDTLVDDGGSVHNLDNGLKAKLIIKDGKVNVHQFGAKGDGVTDDTEAFQKAFDYCKNVACANHKSYNLISKIINVGSKSCSLDLNNSSLIDCCFAFNLNDSLTDWKSAYSSNRFKVKNGTIGTSNKAREHSSSCAFLSGGYLQLENIIARRTPHLVALAQEFIDNFVMKNVDFSFYNITSEEFKELDAINCINKSTGAIVKQSSSTYTQGDGWIFEKVNECHTTLIDNYYLLSSYYHNAITFNSCIQIAILFGTHTNAKVNSCHFESVNAIPVLNKTNLIDYAISFNNCAFVNNFSILDETCVTYVACKFNVGLYGNVSWDEIFTKPLYSYNCKFLNCSTSRGRYIIDSNLINSLWNTPLNVLQGAYDLNNLKTKLETLSFSEISVANLEKGDEAGSYSYTIYVHLNNNLSKAYAKKEGTIDKSNKASFFRSGYSITVGGCWLEIYITYPDGVIKRGFLRIPNTQSTSSTPNLATVRNHRLAIFKGCVGLASETPDLYYLDTLVEVSSIPDREISEEVSKY